MAIVSCGSCDHMQAANTSSKVCLNMASDDAITLPDLLQATPHLLHCLEATLFTDGEYRSSIKALRLVSRQMRDAVMQAVTGCGVRLTIGSNPPPSFKTMAELMSRSPLQRLYITTSPGTLHFSPSMHARSCWEEVVRHWTGSLGHGVCKISTRLHCQQIQKQHAEGRWKKIRLSKKRNLFVTYL